MDPGTQPSKPARSFWKIPGTFVVLMLAGSMLLAADFAAISFRPIRMLGVSHSPVLDYLPVLISATCLVLWVVLRQVVPNMAGVTVILLCSFLMMSIPALPRLYVAEIPVTRELTKDESASLVLRFGIKTTWQNSSQHGQRIFVAREHEAAARDELRTLGILR